jgi:hypothetical protein
MKKLPQTLYARWEQEGADDGYWLVFDNVKDHAGLEEDRKIGVYELVSKEIVHTSVEIRKERK